MANYRQYSGYRSRHPVSGPRRMNRIILVLIGAAIVFFAARALLRGPEKSGENPNVNINLNLSLNLNGSLAAANTNASRKTVDVASCSSPISVAATSEKQVALTLDSSGVTTGAEAILSTLRAENIPAAFFVTGDWVTKNGDLAKAIAASYPVYNHSSSHPDLTTLTAEKVEEQIVKGDETIRAVTGKTTKPFFRPPFGTLDKAGTIQKQIQEAGFCTILWTVDGLDWQTEATVDSVTTRILERLKPGAIILIHLGDEISAAAAAKVITSVRVQGYTFVSLESLIAS